MTRTPAGGVELFEIPPDLFEGFVLEEDPFGAGTIPVALPEKALVDYLLLCGSEGEQPELSGMDLDLVDPVQADSFALKAGISLRGHLQSGRSGPHDWALRHFARGLPVS